MSNDSIPSPFVDTERITSQEMKLLKCFQDLQLLKLLRLVFYQKPLTEGQIKYLKDFIPKDALSIIGKILAPKLSWNAPVFNQGTNLIWFNIKYTDLLSAEVKPIVLGTQKAVKFTDLGMKRLDLILNGQDEIQPLWIDLEMLSSYEGMPSDEVKKEAVAMQKANEYLESGLLAIQGYANRPDDKDLKDKVKKDSTQ